MQIQEIINLVDRLNAKLIVLLCHHNADPDAVCAAYAFSKLLNHLRLRLSIETAAVQGPSRLSKFLLNALPIKLTMKPRIEEADLIVLLDTNTIQQLDRWGERVKASNSPIIVIDHHAVHPETERLSTVYVIDEEATSTCEIVYRFFKEMGVKLAEDEAKALFLGIAFDTKHFIMADSDTFKIVAELIDSGVDPEKLLPLLSLPMDFSERVARLRACQRVDLKKVDHWLIALSHISSYQASAARALISLGAHVAIVAGQRGKVLQISLRSCREFHEKTGIHLGRDVAIPLGKYLHGTGGGHSLAAGVNGVGTLDIALKRCMRLLSETLPVSKLPVNK